MCYDLKDEEAEVARLTSAVEVAREERRAAVADALEAEKEVSWPQTQ